MSDQERKDKGFVFVDKRKTKEEQPEEKERTQKEERPPENKKAAPSSEKNHKEKPQSLPEVDFNFFILSLSSSAMMQMGVIPNPVTNNKEKNMMIAKQTIDIIEMLEKKTRGNLTDEEKHFIESILYDLRMKFVEENKS